MEQGVSAACDAIVSNMSGLYVRSLELMSYDSAGLAYVSEFVWNISKSLFSLEARETLGERFAGYHGFYFPLGLLLFLVLSCRC